MSRPSYSPPSSTYEPLKALPEKHVVTTYTALEALRAPAQSICDSLIENNGEGNQFLVVRGLTDYARNRLADHYDTLGISYRFMWDGSTGIIKVLPSKEHDNTTQEVSTEISFVLFQMNLNTAHFRWGGPEINRSPGSSRGKEPDQCLYTHNQWASGGQSRGWPVLVVETGVFESLPRLRGDANWWFTNSNGAVRIVLLFSIRRTSKRVVVEKWQLVPPGTAAPLAKNAIDLLRQEQPTPVPPLVQQPAATQLSYAAQEITIDQNQIKGSPLIIPFQALFDRPPQANERDIVLGDQELRRITESI